MLTLKSNILLHCVFLLLCASPLMAAEQHPDCSGENRWAASMFGVYLRNSGLSEKAAGYDKVEVERLASEHVGGGIFRQVHKITVHDGDKSFTGITVNDASNAECSESGVDIYMVSDKHSGR